MTPAAQGFGVVQTKGQLVHHFQACAFGVRAKLARTRQATAWKNVLLNEVGAFDIAVKQRVVDDDGLDASFTARLQQACHALEIGGPIFLADSLQHFDGADRVIRAVVNVAVVLQAQVAGGGQALGLHALVGKSQLLVAQGHAAHVRAKLLAAQLGQSAPAAADFKNAVTRFGVDHAQGASHFGGLCLGHRLGAVVVKPRGRIVHRGIKPQLIKGIAQVVMCVDVFLAVAARVAVKQVAHAVKQAAQPAAKDQLIHVAAVGD